MKKILILIGFLYSLNSFSQSTVLLRGDTIKVYKQGGDAVLKVEGHLMLKDYRQGNSNDSVLTWDATTKKVRMMDRSSFGSGGGSGTDNTNLGSFYRLLVPSSQGIKGIAPGYGTLWDSTTNANSLTSKFDSATVFSQLTWDRILSNEQTFGLFYSPKIYKDLDIDMRTNKFFIDNANDFAVNLNTNEFAISGNNGSSNTITLIANDVDHSFRILNGWNSSRKTDLWFWPDSLQMNLGGNGALNMDSIRNGATYNINKLIGWGSGNGVVGYVTPASPITLTSGVLGADTSILATQYDISGFTAARFGKSGEDDTPVENRTVDFTGTYDLALNNIPSYQVIIDSGSSSTAYALIFGNRFSSNLAIGTRYRTNGTAAAFLRSNFNNGNPYVGIGASALNNESVENKFVAYKDSLVIRLQSGKILNIDGITYNSGAALVGLALDTLTNTVYRQTASGGGAGVTDGDKGDITVSSSGATWTFDYKRNMIYAVSVATDANITAAAGTAYSLPAATLSTGRNIDMTNLNTNGDYIEIDNQEAGFTWTFTGQTVYDAYENAVTVLFAQTRYIIRRTNGKLKIIN